MGPSEKDQLEMLKTIGFESLDELVTSTVPANIRLEEPMELGSHTSAAMSETEALALLRSMADKNQVLKSLIGQGYHETHTPYVILRNMLENPVCRSVSRITRVVSRNDGRGWFLFRFRGRSDRVECREAASREAAAPRGARARERHETQRAVRRDHRVDSVDMGRSSHAHAIDARLTITPRRRTTIVWPLDGIEPQNS